MLSVLLDRIFGLLGLLLLALGAVALNPGIFQDSGPEMQAIRIVITLAGFMGVLASVGFLVWPYLGLLGKSVERVLEKLPPRFQTILEKVGEALALVRSSPFLVIKLLCLSVFGHLFGSLTVLVVAIGIAGAESVSFLECLLSTQLANLVAAVPLTPGGIGGRDLTLAYLLKLSGGSESAANIIPLVITSFLIAWSSLGGLALLWEKKQNKD